MRRELAQMREERNRDRALAVKANAEANDFKLRNMSIEQESKSKQALDFLKETQKSKRELKQRLASAKSI